MSLKKLHAGDGYEYLTRQVATGDTTRTRGELLADYYTAHGVPAGQWWGRGAEQLGVSGEVTEAQMRAAYGEFLHPDADEKLRNLMRDGHSVESALNAVQLGRKPFDYNRDIPFLAGVTERIANFTHHNQRVPDREEREMLEHQEAREWLPAHQQSGDQIRGFIAGEKRKARYPVAGYDLVFTPAKSISVLWGIGDEATRTAIMRAHSEAVESALQWVEDNAIYTRAGYNGTKKLDCEGMTSAKFVHWDNRSGDPNLHTHCAVLNRVWSEDRYRTIDGTVLYRAAVTASEHYNSVVTDLVREYLPVSFSQTEKSRGARPVWEIDGIPEELMDALSRRDQVLQRGREIIENYRERYHREPSKAEQYKLMEQANLDTRGAKGQPQSLEEMVTEWRRMASTVSQEFDLDSVLRDTLGNDVQLREPYSREADEALMEAVIATVSAESSTWTTMQVESEVYRQLQVFRFDSGEAKQAVVKRLTDTVVYGHLIQVDRHREVPDALTRADGQSVYVAHGSVRYTHTRVLEAEDRLADAAHEWVAANVHTEDHFDAAARHIADRNGFDLGEDKREFVRHLLFSPARVAVGVGAAGTGKTTAMEAFARAWKADGHRVLALAPSAKAASVLQDSIGVPASTLASAKAAGLTDKHGQALSEGDVVLIDEAGMASTRDLDAVTSMAARQGVLVRMVGDPQQLASIETGGMLGELATATNAPVLKEVHRFTDPEEAEASLRLRAGDTTVLDWYDDHDRIVAGLREELPSQVFADWLAALDADNTAIMIAGDGGTVDALNQKARDHYIDVGVIRPEDGEASISAGRVAAVGDTIVTRQNDGRLRYGHRGKHRVKNGDLWTVEHVHTDGGMTVAHTTSGYRVDLPGDYAAAHVEHGYASTVYRSQGVTVDEAFVLPTASMDRQGLYVALTRGRENNRAYVANDQVPDLDSHLEQLPSPSARSMLESIIARDGQAQTAHTALSHATQDYDVDTERLAYTELHSQLGRDIVRAAAPDDETAQLLDKDWQTARLADTISTLDHAGADTDQILSQAITTAKQRFDAHEVTDQHPQRPSLAFLTRVTIEDTHEQATNTSTEDLLWTVGTTPPPTLREGMDPELHTFTVDTAERLQEHLAAAGDRAVTTVPKWTKQIGAHLPDQREYHAVWQQAVRLYAAAGQHPGVDLTDLDQLEDQRLVAARTAVTTAYRQRDRDPFEAMTDGQLDRYIRRCDQQLDRLNEQVVVLKTELDELRDQRPHESRIAEDRAEITELAEHITTHRTAEHIYRQAQQQANEDMDVLEQAKRSGFIGRSGRVKQAQRDHQASVAKAQEHKQRARESAVDLPPSDQWDRIVALAGNTAEWDQRARVAASEDDQAEQTRAAQAARQVAQRDLWAERREVADALYSSKRPATREAINTYMEQIRDTLATKRTERAQDTASDSAATEPEESVADVFRDVLMDTMPARQPSTSATASRHTTETTTTHTGISSPETEEGPSL